jgi:hypothetical protein
MTLPLYKYVLEDNESVVRSGPVYLHTGPNVGDNAFGFAGWIWRVARVDPPADARDRGTIICVRTNVRIREG